MKIVVPKGKYVVAVSGGVDSMVLMDLLAKKRGLDLIVAHFNHGIRPDAVHDEELVRKTAEQLGLRFEAGSGHLGISASEAEAREARYAFLNQLKNTHQADAIVTAHHQDDVIETALLNIIRGTGRRGLYAIRANENVLRPLIGIPKQTILQYAEINAIEWREDTTNTDIKYLRNRLRRIISSNLSTRQKEKITSYIEKVAITSVEINEQIAKLSQMTSEGLSISRESFTNLPINLGNELILFWLRRLEVNEPDRKTITRLNESLRTAKPGSQVRVKGGLSLEISRMTARFHHSL